MRDGARSHLAEQMFTFLHEYFEEIVITLDCPKCTGAGMDWPPYSLYLTPCDYFLWGALKDIVYGSNPTNLDKLEQSICEASEPISIQTLQDVMVNFVAVYIIFIE